VRALEAFGHRGSATDNERQAAEYLAHELRALGLTPAIEQFRGARSESVRLLIHLIPAAIGAALLWRIPYFAALLAAAMLVSIVVEHTFCVIWISWPVCRSRSQNVCATVPAEQPARRRIILCAHYDTQRSGIVWTIFRPLMSLAFRGPLLLKPPVLMIAGLYAAQVLLALFTLTFGISFPITVAAIILVVAYAVLIGIFAQWAVSPYVPGAADNASGVAAVLELAESWLQSRPAEDVELTILLTGCEESGLMGAAAWADRHRADIRLLPSVFVNIDGIAFGPPRFLGYEVPAVGLPVRASPAVIELCRKLAVESNLIEAGPHSLPGPTDGLAFLIRGIPGITVCGFQPGGVLPHYHTLADTSDKIDFNVARGGLVFANRLMRELAQAPRVG
jgi:hypothetical protein